MSYNYMAWPVAESVFCARSNQTTAFSLPYFKRDLRVYGIISWIKLIAFYNVGNANLNPNKTCGHFCIVRWLTNF